MVKVNRNKRELYPDYTAEIREIKENGFSLELLYKILQKHKWNAKYNHDVYDRYRVLNEAVPIMRRKPRYDETDPINNKINNDFFSEIINFKTGYFAGKPIAYGYSKGQEAEAVTGGEFGVENATKVITDFTTRNNMFGVDMEVTKYAAICGYAGRLFYIDPDGFERVMPVKAYQTIILSSTKISEPEYAVRYFDTTDINGHKTWTVEWYDSTTVTIYTGYLSQLTEVEKRPHMFDYCPLQGIQNNDEMLGDAEKVLALIDDYDKVHSDNSNECEAFTHAQMVFENVNVTEEDIRRAQKTGAITFRSSGTQQGKVYYLTKNINDALTEHHLERTEDNIYRFSDTPNLNDESFGSASGISLKFKLHGLETKCGMFQAKVMDAAQYMWKLLASAWIKRGNVIDPLQVTMSFSRNFPLDMETESRTVQALINAGLPEEIAFEQLSFVEDVNYVMQLKEEKMNNIPDLDDVPDEEETENTEDEEETKKEKLTK